MNLVLGFISGMLIANGIPHFVSGIKGKSHMTPLAKNSSAIVNVVWGFVNFVIGIWLFNFSGGNFAQILSLDTYSVSFLGGVLVMALACAWLFSNPKASMPWFK